jgi:hypothetical protein
MVDKFIWMDMDGYGWIWMDMDGYGWMKKGYHHSISVIPQRKSSIF